MLGCCHGSSAIGPPPRRDRGRRLPADVRDGGALRGVRHPPPRDPGVALRARRRGGATPADPGRQRAPRHAAGRHRGAGRSRHHPRPGLERTRPLRRARARRRAARRPPAGRAARLGVHRRLRARARPACSTDAGPPPTGCTPRSSRRATRGSRVDPTVLYVDEGVDPHLGRHRRRHRPVPPPGPPGPRGRGGQHRRPPHGRPAAPRRRARPSSCRPRCRRAPRTTPSAPS